MKTVVLYTKQGVFCNVLPSCCTQTNPSASYHNTDAARNPFVGLSVLYALKLALEAREPSDVVQALGNNGLDVFVVADNDFYSQRSESGAPSSAELKALPPFKPQDTPIRQVHKTGLGSSAAMTTSLVGSLLSHLGVVHCDASDNFGEEELALIHNTAQLAHCAAQGKVGSGFDVSAAVWGSQLYRRFDPVALKPLLDAGTKVDVEGSPDKSTGTCSIELAPYLDPRNPLWKPSPLSSVSKGESNPTATEGLSVSREASVSRPAPLELPPLIEMALADVDAGSNTPSMVGQINEWRRKKPEWAKQMWSILAAANQTLADGLLALRLAHAQDPQAYHTAVQVAARHFSKDWDQVAKTDPSATLALLIEVRNAMRSIQGGMRALGREAGVPVEPDEMSNVIKATVDGSHGVLGGAVPGAGGYDALFVLYLDAGVKPSHDQMVPLAQIEGVWAHWRALSVGPLLSKAGNSAAGASSASQVQAALLTQGQPSALPPDNTIQPGGLRSHSLESVKGLAERIKDA